MQRIKNISVPTRRGLSRVLGPMLCALTLGTASQVKAQGEVLFGLTNDNRLVSFASNTPGSLLGLFSITGVASGEQLLGIDFRPATGDLYALGSRGNLYTVGATGAATFQTSLFADPTDTTNPFPGLDGVSFGIDFNPVVDRLRVVSDNDQNLRINVDTGATITDTPLGPGNPNVTGLAYTNNFAGAGTTSLYGIDSNTDSLVLQGGLNGSPSPNLGQVSTVGSLGLSITNLVAFDVSSLSGIAYASLQAEGGFSSLYLINLNTGQATPAGLIGSGLFISGLAMRPVAVAEVIPEPGTFTLLGTGMAGLALLGTLRGARRRKAS